MTSTKARSAGLGAVATFAGFAASLGAGTAHAADTAGSNHHAPTPNKVCTIDRGDVVYAALDKAGQPQDWKPASGYQGFPDEPAYGFEVKLKDAATACEGSIDVSLASYTTHGSSWDDSGAAQGFVGYATTTLAKGHTTATLTVKLPGTKETACYGQLDLYFGTTIYDGGTGKGHGPLPDHKHGVVTPKQEDLIASWNGGKVDCTKVTPPTTPPPSSPQSPPSSPPSSPPASSPTSSAPTTPPSSAPSTPVKPTSTAPTTPTPSTPATSTTAPPSTPSSPSTPTLAHTGSNAGAISLVALAFFGAGGTVMMASRKAAARKH